MISVSITNQTLKLLQKKLNLNNFERDTLRFNFLKVEEDNESVVKSVTTKEDIDDKSESSFLGSLKSFFKNKKDNESTILEEILNNLKLINKSFDNVMSLVIGNQTPIIDNNNLPEQDAISVNEKQKKKTKKSSFSLLGTIALGLMPAIISFIKYNPEKLKEIFNSITEFIQNIPNFFTKILPEKLENIFNSVNAALQDIPKFWNETLLPQINELLNKEIIGNATGADILKSAGIAALLYAGKGAILNIITNVLLKTIGFFLKTFFKFMISPAGLAILASVLAGTGIAWVIKKIGALGDKNRKQEEQEKWNEERKEEAKPHVEKTKLINELANASDDDIPKYRKESKNFRSVVANKIDKISKNKEEFEKFKGLSTKEKWNKIEKSFTSIDEKIIKGESVSAAEAHRDSSTTPLVDAKVNQMFPDASMEMQGDYKTKLLGTPEQREKARQALIAEKVSPEDDPIIKEAGQAERDAHPLPKAPEGAIKIDTSKTVDKSTGEGSKLSFLDKSTDAAVPSSIVPEKPVDNNIQPSSIVPEKPVDNNIQPSSVVSNSNQIGQTLANKSVEVESTKPSHKTINLLSSQSSSSNGKVLKSGEVLNINDVPDPNPKLGNLISQLFVPETNFSGAISI